MDAIHITSGAFSVYRKSFFDKYGLFDTTAITEDMEMALRIQYHNYHITNDLRAIAYTIAPNKFIPLLKQRRRWYTGLLKCLLKYKTLFSRKYGSMGVIVIPIALITVLISVIITSYMFIDSFFNLKKQLLLLNSVNFDFSNIFEFNKYAIERIFFTLISSPVTYFFIVFVTVLIFYMIFAKKYVKEHSSVRLSLPLFIIFYAFLFAFWWLISIFYTLFNRKVSWR